MQSGRGYGGGCGGQNEKRHGDDKVVEEDAMDGGRRDMEVTEVVEDTVDRVRRYGGGSLPGGRRDVEVTEVLQEDAVDRGKERHAWR